MRVIFSIFEYNPFKDETCDVAEDLVVEDFVLDFGIWILAILDCLRSPGLLSRPCVARVLVCVDFRPDRLKKISINFISSLKMILKIMFYFLYNIYQCNASSIG